MMQALDQRKRDELPLCGWFDGAVVRTILVQAPMRPMPVIIVKIISQQTVQVLGIEHNDVIQTFSPDGPDEPLDEGILPGRTRGNELLLKAQSQGSGLESQAIDLVAIT